jgi:hypothetical protein
MMFYFAEGDEIPSDKAVGDVKSYGLKGLEIAKIKAQAGGLLAPSDWYVIRYQEDNIKQFQQMLPLTEIM